VLLHRLVLFGRGHRPVPQGGFVCFCFCFVVIIFRLTESLYRNCVFFFLSSHFVSFLFFFQAGHERFKRRSGAKEDDGFRRVTLTPTLTLTLTLTLNPNPNNPQPYP
jgi:hypothetical protein